MSKPLDELLFTMRQHPAFGELLNALAAPPVHEFKESGDAQKQYADYIFRSGRRRQHNAWLQFLTGEPSQQEQS